MTKLAWSYVDHIVKKNSMVSLQRFLLAQKWALEEALSENNSVSCSSIKASGDMNMPAQPVWAIVVGNDSTGWSLIVLLGSLNCCSCLVKMMSWSSKGLVKILDGCALRDVWWFICTANLKERKKQPRSDIILRSSISSSSSLIPPSLCSHFCHVFLSILFAPLLLLQKGAPVVFTATTPGPTQCTAQEWVQLSKLVEAHRIAKKDAQTTKKA